MKSVGYTFAIFAAVLWGLVYAIDEKILTKISPVPLLFFHSVLGVIILLPYMIWNTASFSSFLSLDRSMVMLLLFTHMLSLASNTFILSAIQRLGASTASIFEIAYPFFVVLFSILLYGHKINGYFFLGSLFLFFGSWIIITKG